LIGKVELAVVNQCIKFEVSRFIHYEFMNAGENAENGVVWGG